MRLKQGAISAVSMSGSWKGSHRVPLARWGFRLSAEREGMGGEGGAGREWGRGGPLLPPSSSKAHGLMRDLHTYVSLRAVRHHLLPPTGPGVHPVAALSSGAAAATSLHFYSAV